ncbi:MAG: Fic family protein [Pseudomonas sp.]
MRDKYGVGDDPDCYPGTNVLRNKLGIQDEHVLQEAEAAFAAASAESIELHLGPFTLEYLCQLHRALFRDVYEWAGDLRTVDISKGTTRFCTCARIVPEATRLLGLLDSEPLSNALDPADGMLRIAELYGELNLVHPFREGNGRTQRLLFEHWLLSRGLSVSWQDVAREEWIAGCISAVRCDYAPLAKVFSRCIKEL